MSMEDIIKLMKAQKEEQKLDLEAMFTRQREEEKKNRANEKAELVKEIRKGLKEEVRSEMKPLEERTTKIEEATECMVDKVKELMKKVTTLEEQIAEEREKAKMNEKKKSYSEVTREKVEEKTTYEASKVYNKDKEDENEDVKMIFSKAAKVIGLKPIDKLHVEHIKRRLSYEMKDKSDEELWKAALKKAVEMFLEKEMRIKEDDLAKINITKIFPPAKENWNVLYVELETKRQADFIYTFTQYMRRGVQGDGKPEVQLYVPKQLYKRFMAINLMALKIREDSGRKVGTRVTLGKEDFRLQLRSKVDRQEGWGDALPLPEDLPEIEMSLRRGPLSPGEAPGRSPLTLEREGGRREYSAREDGTMEDGRREGGRKGSRRGSGREDSRREDSRRKDSAREDSSRRSRSSSSSSARVKDVQSRDPSQGRQPCDIYSTPLQPRKSAKQ